MKPPADRKDDGLPLQKLRQYFDNHNLSYEVRVSGHTTVIVVKKKNRNEAVDPSKGH